MHVLKLLDTPLLDFEMDSSQGQLAVRIAHIYPGVTHLMPLEWHIDDTTNLSSETLARHLIAWLQHRSIPANRAYVQSFLARMGLNERNVAGIIDLCRGLSLNDAYWVDRADSKQLFERINLYDNPFNNILAQIAFTGYGSFVHPDFASTPELTTNGAMPKRWRRQNGKIFLYKEGSTGGANTGNEPYAEFYAAQVAHAMGVKAIPYGISRWDGHFCSTCELFTSMEVGFIPAGRLVGSGGINAVKNYFDSLGPQFAEAFADMIMFDAVICNTDRHFGNFGVLTNTTENRITAPAPLFDHGYALFHSALQQDWDNLAAFSQTQLPRTYNDFVGYAKNNISTMQRRKLKHLLDFEFTAHPRYNWPRQRRKAVEQFIRGRARELFD